MRITRLITQWLFILCLPVLLLATSIGIVANSPALYRYGFNRHDVGQTTGLSSAQLEKVIGGIITYFNSGAEDINITVEKDGKPFVLFNDREISHMRDVKGLIRLDYWILLGTFIYAVVYAGLSYILWKDRRRLAWGLIGGGALTLGLMAALGLGALLDFESLFLRFHLISFDNYLWRLDPATDYLIRLFPQGFYYDATLFCAIVTAIGAIILGVLGWWQLKKSGE